MEVIKAPSIDWSKYKCNIFSLTLLEQQLRDWVCSLFVMMALRGFTVEQLLTTSAKSLSELRTAAVSMLSKKMGELQFLYVCTSNLSEGWQVGE